ncbi:MAG: carboxypeptidase-like regulatory domain-containing protein [Saprospiraceae bacterium]|nr:carboxypeptidase-like regulatory domain-containing protein [Saprospiraceae bacterium]
MRTILIALWVFLIGHGAVCQSQIIEGVVTDGEEPLVGCHVYIVGENNGTYTATDGSFQLDVAADLPITIGLSFVGYANKKIALDAWPEDVLNIELDASSQFLSNVVVGASRYEERILEAPVSIFKLTSTQLKSAGGTDYYEAVSNMRGVQAQTSSLFLPSYNVRGFSDPGNFRFKQQMDGYDMTNPIGLAIGNTIGVSDLDIASAELVHGASSALYGSDAFNGVLRFYSKSPFDFPGVSMQTKAGVTVQDAAGINPYFEQDLRVAHLFNDKLAFKFDLNYKRAYDWIGDDFSHRIPAGQWDQRERYEKLEYDDPNGHIAYDAVHRLGDEYSNGIGTIRGIDKLVGPGGDTLFFNGAVLTRSGISEEDLFTTADFSNNKMESFRANFSFFYRPAKGWEMEYTYKHSFSDWLIRSSATFPQFDYLQRFHLFRLTKDGFNFRVYNHKLDNFRGSWSATNAADAIQRALRPNDLWTEDFVNRYAETGSLKIARQYADRFAPGGSEFNKEDFEAALAATSQNTDYSGRNSVLIAGSQAVDFSNYTNVDIDYDFASILPFRLQIGANYRRYNIESGGAFYNDGPLGFGEPIVVNQYAAYAQASRSLWEEKLKLSVALRADKQTDYDLNLSPRATAVLKVGDQNEHIFRASYLTGYRNPSIQEGFFRLQLTSVFTLIGAAERSLENFIYEGPSGTQYSMEEILEADGRGFDPVQPERNTSFELGYRTILNERLMIDASAFFTQYENFINRPNIFFRPEDHPEDFQIFAIRQNREQTVNGMGAGIGLDYVINGQLSAGVTYDWSDFDSPDFEPSDEGVDDDVEKEAFLRSLQFNIPEHSAGVNFNGKQIGPKDRWGFSLSWNYSSAFNYFSNFGELEIPSFNTTDASISYSIPEWKTTIKLGGTNVLRQEYITIYGAPQIGSVYYLGVRYEP